MFRFNRRVAVTVMAVAVQGAWAGAAWSQASEEIGSADIHGSVPVSDKKPVIFHAPALTYDNGALITHPGGGPGGADASRLQSTSLGMTTLGFTASDAGAFRIADDFTAAAPGWVINTVTLFGYQTGSTTTSTFDTVRLQIWSGAPNAGGTVIYGDTTTNRFGSSAFTNIYRDTETTVANNQRPIMATTSAAIGLSFRGVFWIDYQLGGTLASGPFSPPTTILGQVSGSCAPNCNGLQWSGTAWVALDDGVAGVQAQDVRFIIDYVPAPVELQRFSVD